MTSIDQDPLHMQVKAKFVSQGAKGVQTHCEIDLTLRQKGPEMLVWGTGCAPLYPNAELPIQRNNYYYSLTHLVATGTLKIGDTTHNVTGVTWMDHEYGAWGEATSTEAEESGTTNRWTFQNAQFGDGKALSNYTTGGTVPKDGVPMKSIMTFFDGETSHLIPTTTTPREPKLINGTTYFMRFEIEVSDSMHLVIRSLCPDQVFVGPGGAHDGYEGVAECVLFVTHALSSGEKVFASIATGNAWIEQVLGG